MTKIADTLVAAATKSGRLRHQNLITEMEAAYNCRSTTAATTTTTTSTSTTTTTSGTAASPPSPPQAWSFPQTAVPLASVQNAKANTFRSCAMKDTEGEDEIRQWSCRSTSECRLYAISEDLEALDSRTNGNVRRTDRDEEEEGEKEI